MKTNSISSQPSKMCVPNLSLIVPLCTTVSAEKMFHNSTWASKLNNRYSEKNYFHPTRVTCSNHTTKPSNSPQPMLSGLSKVIRRQKLNRRKTQLAMLISRSRARDLPMTRAVTVNWERILQCSNECSIATSPRTGQDNCNSQTAYNYTLTQNNYNDNIIRLSICRIILINIRKYIFLMRCLNCVASGNTLTGGVV